LTRATLNDAMKIGRPGGVKCRLVRWEENRIGPSMGSVWGFPEEGSAGASGGLPSRYE